MSDQPPQKTLNPILCVPAQQDYLELQISNQNDPEQPQLTNTEIRNIGRDHNFQTDISAGTYQTIEYQMTKLHFYRPRDQHRYCLTRNYSKEIIQNNVKFITKQCQRDIFNTKIVISERVKLNK